MHGWGADRVVTHRIARRFVARSYRFTVRNPRLRDGSSANDGVSSYREIPAPPALAQWIECYWELRAHSILSPASSRIIPDGSADLVFHLGDVPLAPRGPLPRSFLVGPLLQSVGVSYGRDTHVVGACLRPAGIRALLDVDARDVTDRVQPLTNVAGALGVRLSRAVLDGPPESAVERLNAELIVRARSLAPPDSMASSAVRLIRESGGLISMHALAPMLMLSPRSLERRFSDAVGMPPKVFARLVRFGGTVQRLRGRGLESGWATLAVEQGYHDQAHLAREVREFAGLTPAALLAELHPVGFVQDVAAPRP